MTRYLDFEIHIAPGTGQDYPVVVLKSSITRPHPAHDAACCSIPAHVDSGRSPSRYDEICERRVSQVTSIFRVIAPPVRPVPRAA